MKLSRLLRPPLLIRKIQGHSMMPVLPPKTLVVGWRWYARLKAGAIVIVSHDHKEKIKRLERVEGNRVYIVGDHAVASTDSRHFGWLDKSVVLARVIWPHAPKDRAENMTNK